ncbi:MAG: flagellar basal body-associated FliL family protein [Deltaproteobacteria bacterium]|jgi:flagellar protein FliL
MSKKNIIIIAGVVLIVLAVIGGGFFMLWQKLSTLDKPQGEESGRSSEKISHGGMGPVFALDSFIVNLSDQGGKRYLRVTMGLELGDPKLAEELTKRLPQIRDSILMTLPSRKVDELQTAEGKGALRSEIVSNLNELLGKETVKKIYITEFVIQ